MISAIFFISLTFVIFLRIMGLGSRGRIMGLGSRGTSLAAVKCLWHIVEST